MLRFLSSHVWLLAIVAFAAALAAKPSTSRATDASPEPAARYVVLVSVDGLRPDAITSSSPDGLPNFYRLRAQSAFTDAARSDADYSVTLPNHMTQLTGRPVLGPNGHNWTSNSDPGSRTLHSNNGGDYVASVFDVVSDHGKATGAYVSKSKFVLLDQSYDARRGAPDRTENYDGRDKIDTFVYEKDTEELVRRFIADLRERPKAFSFLHLRDPDAAGHVWSWSLREDSRYMRAVRHTDAVLGRLLDAIEADERLAGRTTIILTADHGGHRRHHDDGAAEDYTVPFYVWGAAVDAGDLYAMNDAVRQHPGADRPGYGADLQPIRNGDAANLALALLGLPPVPGSTINADQDLRVGTAARTDTASAADSLGR